MYEKKGCLMIKFYFNKNKIFAALAIMLFTIFISLHAMLSAMAADVPKTASKVDSKRLIGHWARTDGDYIIEINEILKDGKLKAAYYNPRPINVARAEFSKKDDTYTIFIELRDVNYPGSKYNLKYDPKSDKLIGTYFQAVQGETYDVEFSRSK
jgi:uncharacterized protein (DUF2147 family)